MYGRVAVPFSKAGRAGCAIASLLAIVGAANCESAQAAQAAPPPAESRTVLPSESSSADPQAMRPLATPGPGTSPFFTGPPAVGPSCESVRLASPDGSCVTYFRQTHGSGRNAQAAVTVACSTASGGFQEEIVRIYADRAVPLRWIDASTLEIGLPTDARFSPPPQSSERPGHTVRYVYKPSSATTNTSAAGCFGPAEDYRKLRLLAGAEHRTANELGWIAYGSAETCLMSGQSGTTEHGSGTLSTQFMKTATARLPHGTSDLVFAVSRYPAQPDAPTVQLPTEDKPLVFEPVGQNGGHRVTGAPADRLFQLLTQSTPLSVRYKGDMGAAISTDVTHQGFEAARIAFESCVAGLSPASK